MSGLEAFVKLIPSLIVAGVLIVFWYLYRHEVRRAIPELLCRIKSVGPKGIEFESARSAEGVTNIVTEKQIVTSEVDLRDDQPARRYPPDYFFLNHTSFLRPERQADFQKMTHVPNVDHFDIRVILDSYYHEALDQVERVKYFLHIAYDQYGSAIRENKNRAEKFLLKEIANGEYVLMAEVYLKGEESPLTFQRYITLSESGPRIERYFETRDAITRVSEKQ